jgi:alkylation response protein AidB-like acyl-CoA dehydrogenase
MTPTSAPSSVRAVGSAWRPVRDLAGGEHFNEVLFDDVRLGAGALLGQEGHGWEQVMAELALERSGPERFLSSIALLQSLIAMSGARADAIQTRTIGRLTARLSVLRTMSLAVTDQLARGENPTWAASVVKDLGLHSSRRSPRWHASRWRSNREPKVAAITPLSRHS